MKFWPLAIVRSNMFFFKVMESCVKNCGVLIHDEIATKGFMEELRELVKQTTEDSIKNKVRFILFLYLYKLFGIWYGVLYVGSIDYFNRLKMCATFICFGGFGYLHTEYRKDPRLLY